MALLLVAATLTAPVSAAPRLNLGDGRTYVTLSSDFFAALGALGLSAGPIGEGAYRNATFSFPITGGVLDLQTARGEINHAGGLFLSTRTTRVELTSFNIDTSGGSPVLTGLVTVNEDFVGRLPLFDLQLPALTLPLQAGGSNSIYVPNVKVTLTSAAAQALNGVFNVTAFTGGFNIGTASVNAIGQGSRNQIRSFNGRSIAPFEND